ncbi:uncharacterized protein V6R79_012256 [Siganus canaliculatus]
MRSLCFKRSVTLSDPRPLCPVGSSPLTASGRKNPENITRTSPEHHQNITRTTSTERRPAAVSPQTCFSLQPVRRLLSAASPAAKTRWRRPEDRAETGETDRDGVFSHNSPPPMIHLSPLTVPQHGMTSDRRHVAMETYWREVQSIEEEKEGEEEEEEEKKSMDEVEVEEAWLMEAGLSSLVTGLLPDEGSLPPAEALLSTLTRQQTATVRKRLDRYNETLKSRNRQPIRDVRDVFSEPDDDSADRCPSPSEDDSADRCPSEDDSADRCPSEDDSADRCPSEDDSADRCPSEDDSADRCPSEDDSADRCPSRPPCHGKSPVNSHRSRYHITTKTIRRHTPTVRPTLSNFLLEDGRPERPPPAPRSPPAPAVQSRQADWLLRDCPYSEGVAEHKGGGACWDCLRFQGDNSDDLPFVPVSPSQALTLADDLSPCDLLRLGFISHIELSTFLLTLGVQTKRTRLPRFRTRDSGVFGVPLNSLVENDRKTFPGVKVPVLFNKLLCILEQTGLQTEGILRVPGSAARLKCLRQQLDRGVGSFDWSAVRQVDAAGLLKLFIRELPTPLLTHLSAYRSVLGVSSVVHQVQALQLLALLLPEAHRETLRALLVFLRKVVFHQDQNRMSLWNVSMVMAPNLFCHHHGNKSSAAKQQEEMEEAVGGARLVRLMITHQDLLWTVPSFLLSQVRHVNEASNQKYFGLTKTTRRLLWRKNDKNDRHQITDLCDGVIRVHAPLHTKVSMAIQLDGQTKARDVTKRFSCDNSPDLHLYEVGGNITERRLHPDSVLLDVYRVNPRCDWLIKP